MQTTFARLTAALSEAKLEISYAKLTAAVGVGFGISRYVLGHTSPADVATDIMATAGTYVISEAAIKLGRGIRNQFIETTLTPVSTTHASKTKKML